MSPVEPAIAEPMAQIHPIRWGVFFVAVASISLLIPFVSYTSVYAIAVGMIVCVLVPMWVHSQRGRFDAFETIHVLGLLYFVFYGMGAIWSVTEENTIVIDKYLIPYMPKAALFCLIGYIALMAGYFSPWFRKRIPQKFEEVPRGVMVLLIPGGLGLAGWLATAALSKASWLRGSIPGVFSSMAQLSPLFLFAWALGWMTVLSGRATRAQSWAVYGLLVPSAVLIISARLNSKALPMFLIGAPIIAWWYTRRKLPWMTLLILLLVLVFIVFPFYNTFRLIDPRIPMMSRIYMTGQIIGDWDTDEYLNRSVTKFKFRMAMINSVAVVIRDVPRWVPYAQGETLFLPAAQAFIPRWVWPDKPYFLLGREFGEKFRVIHILDELTSVAVTVPGELYWNFDLPGIIVGMMFFGASMRFLYRRYGESDVPDPVRRAIHIVVLIQFTYFDGGLAANYVTVLRTLIMFEAFRFVCRNLDMLEMRPVQLPAAEKPNTA